MQVSILGRHSLLYKFLKDTGVLHKPCILLINTDDIKNASSDDPATDRLKTYVKSLPYSVESNSRMQSMLDFILMRLVQCVKAKDYDPGFLQWDSMIT